MIKNSNLLTGVGLGTLIVVTGFTISELMKLEDSTKQIQAKQKVINRDQENQENKVVQLEKELEKKITELHTEFDRVKKLEREVETIKRGQRDVLSPIKELDVEPKEEKSFFKRKLRFV